MNENLLKVLNYGKIKLSTPVLVSSTRLHRFDAPCKNTKVVQLADAENGLLPCRRCFNFLSLAVMETHVVRKNLGAVLAYGMLSLERHNIPHELLPFLEDAASSSFLFGQEALGLIRDLTKKCTPPRGYSYGADPSAQAKLDQLSAYVLAYDTFKPTVHAADLLGTFTTYTLNSAAADWAKGRLNGSSYRPQMKNDLSANLRKDPFKLLPEGFDQPPPGVGVRSWVEGLFEAELLSAVDKLVSSLESIAASILAKASRKEVSFVYTSGGGNYGSTFSYLSSYAYKLRPPSLKMPFGSDCFLTRGSMINARAAKILLNATIINGSALTLEQAEIFLTLSADNPHKPFSELASTARLL